MFITNGPVADTLLVYAKTSPELGAKGMSAFIVEKDFPGYSVARKLKKCGMRGSSTAELVFEDCEVPAENLVGQEDKGVNVMTSGLDIERIVLAGGSVGMAQQALEYSIKYSVEREQFGQSIASFQMIQQKLADMYARTEASRLMVYRAAEEAQNAPEAGKAPNSRRRPRRLSSSLPKRPPGSVTRRCRFMAAMGTALNSPSRSFGGMPNSMK